MIGMRAGSIRRRLAHLLVGVAVAYAVGNSALLWVHAQHEIGGEAYQNLSMAGTTLSDLSLLKADLNELRLKSALIARSAGTQRDGLAQRAAALEHRVERRFAELRARDLTFDAAVPL